MASLEERVSRLEGGQEHLATKADLAETKAELKSDIAQSKVETIKWIVGIGIAVVTLNSSITLAALRIMN